MYYLDFARCLGLPDVVGADGGVGSCVSHLRLLDDQRGAAAGVLGYQHALPHLSTMRGIGVVVELVM